MSSEKNLNISNFLSFFRIFLAIPIFFYLSSGENNLALIAIGIAFITDFLDGYFARYFNQITELGKILDPIADKICTATGFIALFFFQNFPLWLTLLIIGRDLIIVIASLYFLRKKKIVLPSNQLGKITVFFISVYAIGYILKWSILTDYLHYIVIFLVLISIVNYGKVFLSKLKTDGF